MIELWSSNHDAYSHRCRIVLGEKGLGVEKGEGDMIRMIDTGHKPDDLARINPHNRVPVLIDRDLFLYESNIINEYLDERFPHPQLMPLSVAEKGRARLILHSFDHDLFSRMDLILSPKTGQKRLDLSRRELSERLLVLSGSLGRTKYFLGNEPTMVDLSLAPLLWRLEHMGVKLPPKAAPLLKYAERVFQRPSFVNSLTAAEHEMRK